MNVQNHRPPQNSIRAIYIVAAIAILLIIVATAFFIVTDYNNRLAVAQQQTENTTILYHDNAHLVLGSVDSILTALKNLVLLNPSEEELHHFLEEAAAPSPMLRTVLVLNNEGVVIGDSRPNEAAMGIDVSDRQYFVVFQEDETQELFIDNPVQSRVDGAWSMPISMAMYNGVGQLEKVVVVSIEPRYFSTFSLIPEPNPSLTGYIINLSGRILANIPYSDEDINRPIDNFIEMPAVDFAQSHDEVIQTTSDNQFIMSTLSIEPYDMTVVFQQDTAKILASFYQQTAIFVVISALLMGGILIIARGQITLTQEIVRQAEAHQQSEANYRDTVEAASESHFRTLADNTSVFIWLAGTDKSLSYVNKAWLEYTGQKWGEATGMGWIQVLHLDDVEWMSVAFPQDPEKQKPYQVEARFRRYDGEYRWILIQGAPRYTLEGAFVGYSGSAIDITTQKQFAEELATQVQAATAELQAANQQLRQSDNRYRTLAEMSTAYSYSYLVLPDKQIQYEWITDAFTEISGYTVAELHTRENFELIFPDDSELMTLVRERLYAKPLQEIIEYRMICKTGEVKYMMAHVKSEWDETEQRVVRIVGTAQDISRLKRAEDRLRTERNFLQSIMDATPNGILVFDIHRNTTFANARAAQILRLKPSANPNNLHQFPNWEIRTVDDEIIPVDKRPFAEVMRTKKASYSNEQILIANDGQRIPIIVNAAPILDDAGDVQQVVFVFEDISQLKQAEEALRTERNFLQGIMDATLGGIVVTDTESRFLFANSQIAKMVDLEQSDFTKDFVPTWENQWLDGKPIPVEEQTFARVKATKEPIYGHEQFLVTASGKRTPVSINAIPVFDTENNVKHIVYNIENISLRLQWQQQIEEALKQEKELHDLKNRFVTLISHELRTPLSIIMTSTELLQRNFEKLTPLQILNRTDKVQKQVMRLKRIMEDVSFINKTDMVGHQIQLTVIDLPAFAQNIIDSMLLVEENKPQIINQYEGIVTDIVGDETLLYQILVNLVSNAVKYTPNDGTVTILCRVTNEMITLRVEDTGIGIPKADQAKLFQSFHRASNVSNIQGTGLGLDIIRRAVKVLEGDVAFTSKEGEGTTFTVTLPNLAQKD